MEERHPVSAPTRGKVIVRVLLLLNIASGKEEALGNKVSLLLPLNNNLIVKKKKSKLTFIYFGAQHLL